VTISRLPDKKWSKTHLQPCAKPKFFPGVIPSDPRLKRRGGEGVERKGMKEWRREKDWGGERRGRKWEGREGKGKVGRGEKGSEERGEEGRE
jgi:hypothetical protein